jgi:hypothetical protein
MNCQDCVCRASCEFQPCDNPPAEGCLRDILEKSKKLEKPKAEVPRDVPVAHHPV